MASKMLLNTGFALITGVSNPLTRLMFYIFNILMLPFPDLQAAAGIGKETAIAFAEAGVKGVAFADLNEEGAQEAAEESRKYAKNPAYQTLVIKVDVAEEDGVQEMVSRVVKGFGRIDYAVNSAGVSNTISHQESSRPWYVLGHRVEG